MNTNKTNKINKDRVLVVRLTAQEHADLKATAAQKYVTITKYIKGLLYDAFRKDKDLGF